eukprot:m.133760 g.133760  ORF g.133760 m.133760 type:complete len:503 (-) comp13948_c0_seq1:196-1704(-)
MSTDTQPTDNVQLPELMVTSRAKRSTAGNRMARLLRAEIELDDDFYKEQYGETVFQDGESEYTTEGEDSEDEFDSDFDDEDVEYDENPQDIHPEDEPTKQIKKKKNAYVDPLRQRAKRKSSSSKSTTPSAPTPRALQIRRERELKQMASSAGFVQQVNPIVFSPSCSPTRHSKRTTTIAQREQLLESINAKRKRRVLATAAKTKPKRPSLAERLLEAMKTERANLASLRDFRNSLDSTAPTLRQRHRVYTSNMIRFTSKAVIDPCVERQVDEEGKHSMVEWKGGMEPSGEEEKGKLPQDQGIAATTEAVTSDSEPAPTQPKHRFVSRTFITFTDPDQYISTFQHTARDIRPSFLDAKQLPPHLPSDVPVQQPAVDTSPSFAAQDSPPANKKPKSRTRRQSTKAKAKTPNASSNSSAQKPGETTAANSPSTAADALQSCGEMTVGAISNSNSNSNSLGSDGADHGNVPLWPHHVAPQLNIFKILSFPGFESAPLDMTSESDSE